MGNWCWGWGERKEEIKSRVPGDRNYHGPPLPCIPGTREATKSWLRRKKHGAERNRGHPKPSPRNVPSLVLWNSQTYLLCFLLNCFSSGLNTLRSFDGPSLDVIWDAVAVLNRPGVSLFPLEWSIRTSARALGSRAARSCEERWAQLLCSRSRVC